MTLKLGTIVPYALIIDVVVAILLIVTIIYAVGLNRRLSSMRRDRAKLEKIAADFAQSTARANDSISLLKTANESLQRQLESAQTLRDDLAYLLDRGERSADRLEDLVRAARDQAGPAQAAPDRSSAGSAGRMAAALAEPAEDAADTADGREASEAEQALLRALRSAG